MLAGCLKVLINMSLHTSVPNHLNTQKMCNKAVDMESYVLEFVPDHLNTPKMCNKSVRINPYMLKYVPDHLETLVISPLELYPQNQHYLILFAKSEEV